MVMGAGCTASHWNAPPAPADQADLSGFHAAWAIYQAETLRVQRQRDCAPRLIPAAANQTRRGAVVMFHGFGGCPQQFFLLAGRISEQGYDVLMPLQPGHGVLSEPDGHEDLSRLPGAGDPGNRYAEFADRMNRIMALSPGEKVTVGFSLGGAVSLNASLNAPELYDRQLLLSPMLAIRGGNFVEGLAGIAGRTPGIRNIVVKPRDFREMCAGWQAMGRAGFCNYQLRHVVALLRLEKANREMIQAKRPAMPIQLIAAGDEQYVSNDRIEEFATNQSRSGPVSLCFLPDDVPHEMLSPYENKDRAMYWLGDLLSFTTAFIVDGQFVPVEEKNKQTSASACQTGLRQ